MSDIKQELDKIRGRISEPSFLKNEGLSAGRNTFWGNFKKSQRRRLFWNT